jgi:hypothetical protein
MFSWAEAGAPVRLRRFQRSVTGCELFQLALYHLCVYERALIFYLESEKIPQAKLRAPRKKPAEL